MTDPNDTVVEVEEIDMSDLEAEEDFDAVVNDLITPPPGKSPVYIDDLKDVVVDGVWTAREGDQIVVEKWNCLDMNHPRWMGTDQYVVKVIDPLTGDVKLIDEELRQAVMTHVTKGPRAGWRFKFAGEGLNLNQREKRPEQARAAIEKAAAPTVVKLRKDGQPRAKKRPKHIIEAELKAIYAKREARRVSINEKRAALGLKSK